MLSRPATADSTVAAADRGSLKTSGIPRPRPRAGARRSAPGRAAEHPHRARGEPRGDRGTAASAEDVRALAAVRAGQPRHVLDHADDVLTGLQRDGAGALGDLCCRLLRRRHNQNLRRGDELGHRDGDVPGARRHVDEQHVEVAPPDVGKKLLDGSVQHRPAPHDRVFPWVNMPIEMIFTPYACGGMIISSTGRPCAGAEHPRDRVPIDVRIQHADLQSAAAIAAARFTVTDDLPTPPLPDATA